jgi:hypothetical protein
MQTGGGRRAGKRDGRKRKIRGQETSYGECRLKKGDTRYEKGNANRRREKIERRHEHWGMQIRRGEGRKLKRGERRQSVHYYT